MIRIITIADTKTGVNLTVGQDYTTIGEDGLPNYDRLTITEISPHLTRVSLRGSNGAASVISMSALLENIARGLYRCVGTSI